jgi:hypothetical protein
VGLRAPAVVRLVRALAHVRLSVFVRPGGEPSGVVVSGTSSGVPWRTTDVDAARPCTGHRTRALGSGQQTSATLAERAGTADRPYAAPAGWSTTRARVAARSGAQRKDADTAGGIFATRVRRCGQRLKGRGCAVSVPVCRSSAWRGRRQASRAEPDDTVSRSAR